jgi:threonylcarbamoyladenosine tRNA methylthiotransferase MtaB
MKIHFITRGCRLNHAEALDEQALAITEGHEIVNLNENPDVIVYRACSITQTAQSRSEHSIKAIKRLHPNTEVIVKGCLPGLKCDARKQDIPIDLIPMGTSRAYLKVQDGCSGKCTYCIVPQFRGLPHSISFHSLIERSKNFIAAGYHEIVVTGCNLALYHSEGKGLVQLLDALASLDENVRIRLGSYEPCAYDNDLIKVFADHKNICRFLHISLQSASDNILKRMNRPYTAQHLEDFCSNLRTTLGDYFMLGYDVITGFPGETDEDFVQTRLFLERYNFCNHHSFPYSERPGTPAATMEGAVDVMERSYRTKELGRDSINRLEKFTASFIGREVEMCIETPKTGDSSCSFGFTGEYIPAKTMRVVPRRSLFKGKVVSTYEDSAFALIVEPKED